VSLTLFEPSKIMVAYQTIQKLILIEKGFLQIGLLVPPGLG